MKQLKHLLYTSSLSENISELENIEDINIRVPHRYTKKEKPFFYQKELFLDNKKNCFYMSTAGKTESAVWRGKNEIESLINESKTNHSSETCDTNIQKIPKYERINLLKFIKFGGWINNPDWQDQITLTLKEAIDVDWLEIAQNYPKKTFWGLFSDGQKIGLVDTDNKKYGFVSAKGPAGWIRQNLKEAKLFNNYEDFYNHIDTECDMDHWIKGSFTRAYLKTQKNIEITEYLACQAPDSTDLTIEE